MALLSLLSSQSTHDPCGAGPRPPLAAASNVFHMFTPIHLLTQPWVHHACPSQPPHGSTTTSGATTVFINGLGVARVGDTIGCGSTINTGGSNVYVGR